MKVVEQNLTFLALIYLGGQTWFILRNASIFFIPEWFPCLKLSDSDSVDVCNSHLVRHKLQPKETLKILPV